MFLDWGGLSLNSEGRKVGELEGHYRESSHGEELEGRTQLQDYFSTNGMAAVHGLRETCEKQPSG